MSEPTKQVEELIFTIVWEDWKVKMPLEPSTARQGLKSTAKWLFSFDPPRFIPMEREECSFLTYVFDTIVGLR